MMCDMIRGVTRQSDHVRPIDVPTRETVTFLESHLPPGAEVLEIGCGAGDVARALSERGFRVRAIDPDPECVEKSRAKGVEAVQALWPDVDTGPADAVVFTRSLHHIGPMREALVKARELLRPSGLLLVEDFAFEATDERTMRWFCDRLREESSRVQPVEGEFATELLASSDPIATWHTNEHKDLHSAAAMTRAIWELFVVRETQDVPYVYRYFVPVLPETEENAEFVERFFEEEHRAAKAGEIVHIGRRIVATAPAEKA